jgi:hypothetical protein
MEQPGFSAGQSAHTLWIGDSRALPHVLQQGSEYWSPRSLLPVSFLHSFIFPTSRCAGDWDEASDMAAQDLEHVYDVMSKRTAGHSIPWWSAPKNAWRTMLVGSPENRCKPLHDRLQLILSVVPFFCNRAPLLWCLSESARVDKNNCKTGCSRWRLVQLLDYIGSVWASSLWNKQPHF